ncbi:MAG: hypothetical protein CMK96_02415 [Pseudomonas sp.]|jgi:hypothetical protein|nr:hypothetical protein [Pseudomonadales bacterium]MAK85812.1 hypothetical protein [Pseudomonas sp.]HAG77580.1 hypothetical protein [Pseudomonas sp.]HCH78865.1 hypothetical protein [Pseudomonas sp.]|tara:strand:+ start:3027 stop:7205 length:4179 start_codon:yes stop_codon:yes gene_type:complete
MKGLVAPVLSVTGAVAGLSKALEVQRQFDVLNAGLITATGGAVQAADAFAALQDFARKTPYDLNQAVEGFTKLVNLGLTPSERALTSYGNTASAMGKDLNQMIEAVADAATGEFERLKEFGIKAKAQGDTVSLTFQGVTQTIGSSAADIENYLTGLGNNQFAGAMDRRVQTLDGAVSNLGDTWDQTYRLINEAGLGELMESSVRSTTTALDELNAQLESGQLQAKLDAVAGKFSGWGGDISQTLDIVGDIFESATGRWGALVDNNVDNMTSTFANFPENVRAFIQLMTVEVLSGFDKVTAYSAAFKDGIKAIFTDDTMEGVGARLEADLQRLNELRDDSIASILEERDAALTSYSDQMSAAQDLRKVYDDAMERSAQATADRLAKFKALGSSAGAAGDAVEKLGKKLKNLDATGPGDAINDYIKQFEKLHDELNPAEVAAREYGKQQDLLNDIIARGGENADKARGDLAKLREQYEENNQATSEWAQWTEGALDRVDGAFADAWRNIGDGFDGFRDSLTNAFKQMLAELAHMAITKPIIMQIGAALGIGGGTQGNNGIWGSLLGGGSGGGGLDFGKLLNYGQTAYSMFTGVGPAVMAGWQSGGLTGAIQGGAGYYGNMLSGAASTVGSLFGYGGAAGSMAAGSTAAGYTGAAYANWAAGAQAGAGGLSAIAGNLGAIAGPIAGLYMAIKGYGAISDGYDFKPKDFDDEFAGVRLGAKVINAYENGITKVFGDSSFLSKALRIPVATIGGLMSSVFGGGWETKNYGMAFSVANGDFLGQSYEDQKKKGGLFGSDKKRTKYRNLDPETAAVLQETFDATESGVSDLLARIGVSVTDGAYAGLEIARRKISTKGKTEEEISAAIGEWFEFAGDRMIAEIDKGIGGFGYSLEELTQRINVFEGVNDSLELINVAVLDLSAHSMELANGMAEAAGGMDAFSAGISAYYGSFFSAAEQQDKVFASLVETFAEAEQVLAASRQDYRDMVEAIDVTTESGRELFATLMGLSQQAAQYYDILEAQAAEAINAAGNAFSGLQAAINAEVGQLQTQYQAAQASANGLLQLSNSLQSALRSMRMDSDAFDQARRKQAQAQLTGALAFGRAGGDLTTLDLSGSLSELGRDSTQFYGTFEEYARDYWRTANDINSLDQLTGKQLSVEKKTLEAIEGQFAYFDQMLLDAQNELNALMGIDTSVMSVAAALANFKVAVGAAETAKNAAAPKTAKQTIADTYESVFGRDAGSGEVNYWLQRIGEGTATAGNLADLFKTSDEYKNGGFATGGYTGAGGKWEPAGIVHKGEVVWSQSDIAKWGGVGAVEAMRKNGPELEVTGPSRIYNASQTAAMLGGGDSTAAITSLQRTVEGQSAALRSIAKHTMQTAKRVEFLERWDYDGLPTERDVA